MGRSLNKRRKENQSAQQAKEASVFVSLKAKGRSGGTKELLVSHYSSSYQKIKPMRKTPEISSGSIRMIAHRLSA